MPMLVEIQERATRKMYAASKKGELVVLYVRIFVLQKNALVRTVRNRSEVIEVAGTAFPQVRDPHGPDGTTCRVPAAVPKALKTA